MSTSGAGAAGSATGRAGTAGSAASSGVAADGASGAAGAPTTSDAGSGGSSIESGSAGDAGQDQGGSTFVGTVAVGVMADSGGSLFSSASAHFTLPIEQPNCTTQAFGDCRVTLCDPPKNLLTKADAGTITVNFADKFSLEMSPTDQGYYADPIALPVVTPGATISVVADGDEIPAFSSSVVQPEALRLSSPAVGAYGQLAVSVDTDLELTFTGGTSGVWLGALSQGSYTTGGSFSVQCSFASQAGHALISKNALYYSGGFIALYTFRPKTVAAGAYAIDLMARSVVFDSEGLNDVNITIY